jgi:hypothetical protein
MFQPSHIRPLHYLATGTNHYSGVVPHILKAEAYPNVKLVV